MLKPFRIIHVRNIRNYVCKQMSFDTFENVSYKLFPRKLYNQDLALDKPSELIGHKIQSNQTRTIWKVYV